MRVACTMHRTQIHANNMENNANKCNPSNSDYDDERNALSHLHTQQHGYTAAFCKKINFRVHMAILPTNSLKLLAEKLLVTQLVKKFSAFYVTQRFITVFIRGRYLPVSWARCIQSTFSHPHTILICSKISLSLSMWMCMNMRITERHRWVASSSGGPGPRHWNRPYQCFSTRGPCLNLCRSANPNYCYITLSITLSEHITTTSLRLPFLRRVIVWPPNNDEELWGRSLHLSGIGRWSRGKTPRSNRSNDGRYVW
jgi:hypothetical protein